MLKKYLLVYVLIVIFMSPEVFANEYWGRIVKFSGPVHVIGAKGEKRTLEENRYKVKNGQSVYTGKKGNVVIKFSDGGIVILNQNSRFKVIKPNLYSHLKGKIYYAFKKMMTKKKKMIRSKTAVIGVRGTTFIINDDEKTQNVALKEGNLNIESLGPAFEVRRKKVRDEFDDFKESMYQDIESEKKEYEAYVSETKKEFIEYKKAFVLQENYQISIYKSKVEQKKLDDVVLKEFDYFEDYAGEEFLNK